MENSTEMRRTKSFNNVVTNNETTSRLDASSETDSGDGLDLLQGKKRAATRPLRIDDQSGSAETMDKIRSLRLKDLTEQNSSKLDYQELQEAHDSAFQDFKAASRDVRDQSIEIRDLKRQNTQLQERNTTLREQNEQLKEAHRARGEKLLKSEKMQYIEHFNMLEDHISHLKHEMQKREAHMEVLTLQTREANEEQTNLEVINRKLQRQVRDFAENLTECKDDLLRLQPINQVSDNEISELYADLEQQISGWVDEETEDMHVLESQIGKIGSVDDIPKLFKQSVNSDIWKLAKDYPECQPLLLKHLIYCYLGTCILYNNVYFFGLDARNIALLRGIEEGMRLLEPRRDSVALRQWRSETLQGLLRMESFAAEQKQQGELVARTLHEALSTLMNESLGRWQEIHKRIVSPAIELSVKLRLSATEYRLASRRFAREPGQGSDIFVREIKDCNMIDMATQKVIRPDSNLKVTDNGRIGQEILIITPALLREQKGTYSGLVICKPTVLVKLDEPMGKRSRGLRALASWTPSWLGSDDAVTD